MNFPSPASTACPRPRSELVLVGERHMYGLPRLAASEARGLQGRRLQGGLRRWEAAYTLRRRKWVTYEQIIFLVNVAVETIKIVLHLNHPAQWLDLSNYSSCFCSKYPLSIPFHFRDHCFGSNKVLRPYQSLPQHQPSVRLLCFQYQCVQRLQTTHKWLRRCDVARRQCDVQPEPKTPVLRFREHFAVVRWRRWKGQLERSSSGVHWR